MKSFVLIVLVIGLVLLAGTPLWSQENEDQPELVSELIALLQSEGWSAEEVRALVAQDVDWENAEGADPEVVALALQFAVSEDEDMEPMAQALLAVDVAVAAIQMEALGIGEMTVALTALEGVREILTDVKSFRTSAGEMTGKQLADSIRSRIGEQVVAAAREHAEQHLDERAKAARANAENLVPDLATFFEEYAGYWSLP